MISMLFNAAAALIMAVAGVAALFWIFGEFDKRLGSNFRNVYRDQILAAPLAAAVYHGLRFFGGCYLIGALFGKFI